MILCILLLAGLSVNALAAPEGPVITMQPQSRYYSEYSVAVYTVKATGTNLSAYWYMEWEGKTYNASEIGGAMQPWEAYAGEAYGAKKLDNNTFCFIFQGIEEELSGAKIWCVIEDGHYDVISAPAYIVVGDYGSPPEILEIPTQVTVEKDQDAEIRCIAKSSDGSQLNFLWYETPSGKFEDMRAIDRGAETGDYMFCDTMQIGTRYYICGITTSAGGMAYSSVVEVTVVQPTTAATTPPPVVTVPPTTTPTTEAPTEIAETTPPPQTETAAPTEPATQPTTQPSQQPQSPTAEEPVNAQPQETSNAELPWWALTLIALFGAGAGVGTAVILIHKNKK